MKLGENTSLQLGQTRPQRLGGWKAAIADAERKIDEAKARLARLKAALSFCRESLENGDPFPGEPRKRRNRTSESADKVMSQT